jgi:hypothetical protein
MIVFSYQSAAPTGHSRCGEKPKKRRKKVAHDEAPKD